MKVTIIITNFNKEEFIKEAIESALNQDYSNFDILIIDDGSTDGSREVIKQFHDRKGVEIVFQENKGVVTTRNFAISKAKGELIVQLDGDDILDKGYVKRAVNEFSDEAVGIVYGRTSFIGIRSGVWDLGEYTIKKQLFTNQIVISAMFRKQDFLRFGGYDVNFTKGYEDWDFWMNLIFNGRRVIQLDIPMLKYRILADSRNRSISQEQLNEIRDVIYSKYRTLYEENFPNVITLLWEIEQYKQIEESYIETLSSVDFKIGKAILSPIRYFRKMFK